MRPTAVLATVTGRDRPGVTAAFFAALAAHDVDVRDVEQVVIRDRLVLTVLVDLRGDPRALRSSAVSTANALGMECEVTIADDGGADTPPVEGARTHVIVLGRPLRPGAVSHVAQRIADLDANIESISRLSDEPVASLELLVRAPDPARLRAALVQAAEDTGVDIAIEPAEFQRRAKRLVALDVDALLVQGHADTLRARVQQLAGLPLAEVQRVRDELRLAPGARTFVRTLRRLGYRVGIVSGGFTVFTDRVVADLELDFAAANELEIVDGIVTGNIAGPPVAGAGKGAALVGFANDYGVPLSQTVAVGHGADDVDLLGAAGLGIAINARSARQAADGAARASHLDTVLFVLGISDADVVAAQA